MEYRINNININRLFEVVFGVSGLYQYRPEGSAFVTEGINYQGITIIEDPEQAARLSYLGTPILFPIKIVGGSYQVYNELGQIVSSDTEDFEFPATTLVNFRRAKVMGQTKVLGDTGTVKEIYGFTDWAIDIRGICLRDPGHPQAESALQQIRAINKLENIVDSIYVEGLPFSDRDIHKITINEIDTPQVKGRPGVIPFSLRCSSDKPIELIF